MATGTMVYRVSRGLCPLDDLIAKVQAVPLDRGEYEFLGLTLSSDTTAISAGGGGIVVLVGGTTVTRTIRVTQTAQGLINFPTAASLIAILRDLFTAVLELGVPANVDADEPVVTP